MAMFPDSGVPPADAKNSLPDVDTAGCDELWYSTSRCQPRFDPAAANAMLAEQMNLIMKGEVQYKCPDLNNVELATRYIIQRGLQTGGIAQAGPFDYLLTLDPPLTRYNNYLTLIIVPASDNQGAVRINVNGKGLVPILRNDGQQLKFGDMLVNRPALISYWSGAFYMVGLVSSQVLKLSPALEFWIRTDGNDSTGDGTANTAAKAFRTIAGCWYAVGSRYAATPTFAIHMKLGIPGTYEGTNLGPFGGNVSLTGDEANPSAYRISGVIFYPGMYGALWISGIASMFVRGVSLLMDRGPPDKCGGLICVDSNVGLLNSRIEVLVSNSNWGSAAIGCTNSIFGLMKGTVHVVGNGNTLGQILIATNNGSYRGAWIIEGEVSTLLLDNIVVSQEALSCAALSTMHLGNVTFLNNVTGRTYNVTENSIISMNGKTPPGTVQGVASSGGIFIP